LREKKGEEVGEDEKGRDGGDGDRARS